MAKCECCDGIPAEFEDNEVILKVCFCSDAVLLIDIVDSYEATLHPTLCGC